MSKAKTYTVTKGGSLSKDILLNSTDKQEVMLFIKSLTDFVQETSFVNGEPILEWLFDNREMSK